MSALLTFVDDHFVLFAYYVEILGTNIMVSESELDICRHIGERNPTHEQSFFPAALLLIICDTELFH